MTEAEWLACDDPREMLRHLRGKAIGRPLALFAVACCRAQRSLMSDPRSRHAVEWSERLIEGQVTFDDPDGPTDGDCYLMATAANRCLAVAGAVTAGKTGAAIDYALEIIECLADASPAKADRRLRKASVWARCLFGNPFGRLAFDPVWPTADVTRVAQAAYDERRLDPVRLAVLSDALEEAGCDDAAILAHLRSPGPHVRGCWAIDLILGKQ